MQSLLHEIDNCCYYFLTLIIAFCLIISLVDVYKNSLVLIHILHCLNIIRYSAAAPVPSALVHFLLHLSIYVT